MKCKKPFQLGPTNVRRTPDNIILEGNRQALTMFRCGRCSACLATKRQEWMTRILLESMTHDMSLFLTLTYNDDFLPENCSVDKVEIRNFFKRLRYRTFPRKIRYFAVGEYGDTNHRPHYHAIVFGMAPFEKEIIKKSWSWQGYPLGYVYLGEVNKATARYTASYVIKNLRKLDDYNQGKHPYMWRGGVNYKIPTKRTPEFMTSSRHDGGIGAEAARIIGKQLKKDKVNPIKVGMIRIGKSKLPVGRYIRNIILQTMGLDDDKIKEVNNAISIAQLSGDSFLGKSYFEIRNKMLPLIEMMEHRSKIFNKARKL